MFWDNSNTLVIYLFIYLSSYLHSVVHCGINGEAETTVENTHTSREQNLDHQSDKRMS